MNRSTAIRILFVLMAAGAASACGGAPRSKVMQAVEANDLARALEAYDAFREHEESDNGLLAHVAGLVLEEAALSDDLALRDAAFAELSMAGTAAKSTLDRLSTGGRPLPVRARALGLLARRGDGGARDALRGLIDDESFDVVSAAVIALDPAGDLEKLVELLAHPAEKVRREAAAKLAEAAPLGTVRAALAEIARVDPAPGVRAQATRSLGEFGAEAFEMLRERLSDADEQVRVAAVAALTRADRERALSVLGPLLEMAPNPAAIEAARVLAGGARRAGDADGEGEPEGAVLARAYLRRALETGDPGVRSQAAVALSSLSGESDLAPVLTAALEREVDPQVKLSLAILLLRGEETASRARPVLATLMDGEGMPAVHAAGALAKDGSAAAAEKLAAFMRDGAPEIRRVAARALARDAMRPDAARAALRDEDALVRIRAAGGIVAAASAS